MRKPKLGERIAQQMIEEIIQREWPVGKMIGTERDLIKRLKISRATFREAIRQVERHGVAKMRRGAGGGLVVADSARRTTERALATYLEITDVSSQEQTEVRRILDSMAARLAAERAQPSDIAGLRALTAPGDDNNISFAENARKMLEVRLAIADATQNPALALFIQALNDALVTKLGVVVDSTGQFEADQKRTHLGNRELVEAIVAGDTGRAERQIVVDFELRRESVAQLDALLQAAAHTPGRQRRVLQRSGEKGGDKKAGEITAAKIAYDIRLKGWQEGAPLGAEGVLQERYGVSRAVLREAVRFLEMHRVVRTKSGARGGLVIDSPDPSYTVRCCIAYLKHLRMRARDLWEIQSALEITAAELAATPATAEDLRQMDAVLTRMLNGTPDSALGAAADLHSLIAQATKNRALALFLRVLILIGQETLPSIEARAMRWLERVHRELVVAIASRDSGMARRRMIGIFSESARWVRTAPNF